MSASECAYPNALANGNAVHFSSESIFFAILCVFFFFFATMILGMFRTTYVYVSHGDRIVRSFVHFFFRVCISVCYFLFIYYLFRNLFYVCVHVSFSSSVPFFLLFHLCRFCSNLFIYSLSLRVNSIVFFLLCVHNRFLLFSDSTKERERERKTNESVESSM